MAIQKILLEEFLRLRKTCPVLDVRSPGEYTHAHLPGAYSLPLFTDEERKLTGTAYKQQNRETAIKIGLEYFGPKMRAMVEEVESFLSNYNSATNAAKETGTGILPKANKPGVIVHCWRGGMRSAGVAWLLDLYGFKVYTLCGGYKSYRRWVKMQIDKQYPLTVVGGYTGSGKTILLHELQPLGHAVIDLEKLAHHKGSAFGALGEMPQPSQEMFENLLAENLFSIALSLKHSADKRIFIEDESQRIGRLNIPKNFWLQMHTSPLLFLDIPFEERLTFLTAQYSKFNKEETTDCIIRLQKRLGGQATKTAVAYLLENDYRQCFSILLQYYDKYYAKALNNRDNLSSLLKKISCATVDINNSQKLVDENVVA